MDLTLGAVAFSAMGTAGQRCTTLRRLLLHGSIYDAFLARLKKMYESVTVGDPRDQHTLVGPLIDHSAFDRMQKAFADAQSVGGRIWGGTRVPVCGEQSYYVKRRATNTINYGRDLPLAQEVRFEIDGTA